MSIQWITDPSASIFESNCGMIVIPVNCQPGVLGAGLAKAAADRWPVLKQCHWLAVGHRSLAIGKGHHVTIDKRSDRYGIDPDIFMLPTKDHWKDKSRLEWVEAGLDSLIDRVKVLSDPERDMPLKSVGIPALGAGLGGLAWDEVKPVIEAACERLPFVEWKVYGPMCRGK